MLLHGLIARINVVLLSFSFIKFNQFIRSNIQMESFGWKSYRHKQTRTHTHKGQAKFSDNLLRAQFFLSWKHFKFGRKSPLWSRSMVSVLLLQHVFSISCLVHGNWTTANASGKLATAVSQPCTAQWQNAIKCTPGERLCGRQLTFGFPLACVVVHAMFG